MDMDLEIVDENEVIVDKYSVEDLLKNVNYSFPNYKPSPDAFKFINFMRLVLGEEPENKNSLMHYYLIDTIFRNVKPLEDMYGFRSDIIRENYVAVMIHREGSKSVLLGTMFSLYLAYYGSMPNFGKVYFGGYIGNSMRKGVRQNMQTIAGVYKDSIFLQDKFEYVHFTDTSVKFIRHPRKNKAGDIVVADNKESKRTFVLEGYGAAAGPRGSRDGLVRPQFFIIDDVIGSSTDARSDVILGNVSQLIEEDIGYALHGGENSSFCIYIGTPFNLRDPLMKSLVDGTWTPIVFPICEHISLSLTKEEFHGSWEDRHSYKAVMTKYKTAYHKGTLPAFMQEQMLRVASDEDRMIPSHLINWFDRRDVILNAHNYNWYMTTDFTTTGSKGSDFSGICVWAAGEDGNLFLVDFVLDKLELRDQYEAVFDLVRKYKRGRGYIEVGIEVDGQQRAHIFALEEMMVKKSEYFTIARQKGKDTKGILRKSVKGNKFDYFKLVVPLFQNGKFWFPNEMKTSPQMEEALSEIYYVSYAGLGSANDDFLDCLSMTSQLKIIFPTEKTENLKQISYNVVNDIFEDDDNDYIDVESSGVVF